MLAGARLMPAIPLALIDVNGNLRPRTLGLVDSGCDYSTLPGEWAAQLGIDLDDCLSHQGGTAGGLADKYLYEPGIHAAIQGRKLRLTASFSPKCPVILMGREDFFRHFKVGFNQAAQTFRLEAENDWAAADLAVKEAIEEHAHVVRAAVAAEAATELALRA